jgi:hypothetical protein
VLRQVYGVSVPGYDGRCGMAALVLSSDVGALSLGRLGPPLPAGSGHGGVFDLQRFAAHAAARLAPFALPVFVRVLSAAPVTETFKHVTAQLRAAGADPTRTGDDALFVLVPTAARLGDRGDGGGSASAGLAGMKGVPLPAHALTDTEADGGAAAAAGAYAYVPLTLDLWHDLVAGRARL